MAGQVRYLKVKGGRFYARLAVPKALQTIVGKSELLTPIGADRREAMRALPGAVADLQRQLTIASRRNDFRVIEKDYVSLTQAAKTHYAAELAADDAERMVTTPGLDLAFSRSIYASKLRLAVAGKITNEEIEALIGYAANDLTRMGLVPDLPRREFLRALAEVQLDALTRFEERDRGQVKPSEPQSPHLTAPDPEPPVPLKKLFRDYIAARQAIGKHKDGARSWENAIHDLSKFVGHTDARRITKRNLLDWRDHLLASGKAPKTIANLYLAAVRALFRWAFENDRLPTNEAETVRQEVPKVQRTRERGYTDKEAVKLLSASVAYQPPITDNPANRESPKITAAKRWLPILCAFTGARVAEMAQLRKEDVRREGTRLVMRIAPDAGTVKAGGFRDVPLHDQLVELGFENFLDQSAPGPLFHNSDDAARYLTAARGTAGRVSQWLQGAGLVPEGVQPSHGWRHRFKTTARELGLSDRVIDAIQGHAGRTASDDYGDVSVAARARIIDALPRYKLK